MAGFIDFCEWMKTQRRAADALGVSEATISRWVARGCVPSVEAAERVESASRGIFKWQDVIRPAASTREEAA